MTRIWAFRGRQLELAHPIIMGILNVTPDSFSDGGIHYALAHAVDRAHIMLHEGADIIDVGGESTRPQGARAVSASEEVDRIIPVIERLRAEAPDAIVSVDTVKSVTAAAALEAGAHIVNDVSAFRLDPHMADVCRQWEAGVILMHSRGDVSDMGTYAHASYENVEDEVLRELRTQLDIALAAGIPVDHIALDPGIGFAKRSEHSLRMIACVDRLVERGHPVVVGVSRKRFIGELNGQDVARERVFGSVGAAVAAFARGAHIFRVHDVRATREALDVAAAIGKAGEADLPSRGMTR